MCAAGLRYQRSRCGAACARLRQAPPAVDFAGHRNVGHGQRVARHEGLARQVRVQQVQQRLGGGDGGVRPVGRIHLPASAFADQLHKGVAAGRVQRGLLPVHPALGIKPAFQAAGVELAIGMFGAQIPHDHIRFPQRERAILQQRHHGVRVARQVLGCLHDAKLPAGVGALVRQAQRLHRPDDLAHIDRAHAAPDAQHAQPPFASRMAAASAAMPVLTCSTLAVTKLRRSVRGSAWSA
jgi:hypothetical protein